MGEKKKETNYFKSSRDIYNGLVFVLPLLLFYQIGLLFTDFKSLNGADFLTPLIMSYAGKKGLMAFHFLLIFVFVTLFSSVQKKEEFRFHYLIYIFLESLLYSLAMLVLINMILQKMDWRVSVGAAVFLLSIPYFYFGLQKKKDTGTARTIFLILEALMLGGMILMGIYLVQKWDTFQWEALKSSHALVNALRAVGAGVNEEIFFRVILFGSFFYFAHKKLDWEAYPSFLIAAILSGLLFALAHHIGQPVSSISTYILLYRMLAGIIFCILFLTRGVAVAIYMHTLYDLMYFFKDFWGG
ncbi:MAG: CPBP family intramembrane metalloprotease [Planctomycetota bacterium]|nr:MAG: CPBP family intramembrane metalloprotease [Planctomycetota bacterium]